MGRRGGSVSLDAFSSAGNQILAWRLPFMTGQKLYNEFFCIVVHISFVQKIRGYIGDIVERLGVINKYHLLR